MMDLALAAVVIFVGAFVQASIGFGLAVISAPLLFFINPLYVPAPITVSALILSLALVRSHRRVVALGGLRFAIYGRIPGTVVGAMMLLAIDQRTLALWLGLAVLLAVVVSLTRLRWQPTPGALLVAGFFSGFMGTSSSIGGPPMALVLQHQASDYVRANLAAFFVVSCLLTLAMLAAVGRFGWPEIRLSLPLVPATLAGYWVAMGMLKWLPLANVRLASLALCAVSGGVAVLSYWF